MAISKTTIINTALIMVGEKTISSPNDNSKAAKLANQLYELCVEESFDLPDNWKFATSRKELSELATTPAIGTYDHQYILPPEQRRVLALVALTSDDFEFRWRKEFVSISGKEYDVILTNEVNAYVKYIVLREDPAKWPAWFVKLVYMNMAIKLAQPLSQDKRKVLQFAQLWEVSYFEAQMSNAKEDVDVDKHGVRVDEGNNDVIDAARNGVTGTVGHVNPITFVACE